MRRVSFPQTFEVKINKYVKAPPSLTISHKMHIWYIYLVYHKNQPFMYVNPKPQFASETSVTKVPPSPSLAFSLKSCAARIPNLGPVGIVLVPFDGVPPHLDVLGCSMTSLKNAGTLGIVPLIINSYTPYCSEYLLGISPSSFY